MTTISITFPAGVADLLNAYVPGFAGASGGGGTVALQVPAAGASGGGAVALQVPASAGASGSAAAAQAPSAGLPSQVVAGLNDAGFQVPVAVAAGAPAALPENAAAGAAQFAPAGLVPQGAAAEDPNLAGAVAFAQALGQQASSFFQQAANGQPISQEQFASFASQQNAAISDYIFGGA